MLKRNKGLIRLILKSNPIGNEGCKALISSLSENNTLRVLNLADCQISAMKSLEVYKSLTENKSLTVLWLVDNNLGEGTGNILYKILTKNKTLKWINLQGN